MLKYLLPVMLFASIVFGQNPGHFMLRNDYGVPFSAFAMYDRLDFPKNSCYIMLPDYYSFYYSNSSSKQYIILRSESASMNWNNSGLYADPEFQFTAFIDNSTSQQNALSRITAQQQISTITIYNNATATTFMGYPAYRVTYTITSVSPNCFQDWLFFTKDNQSFMFGYLIDNLLATVSKQDSILSYTANAIQFFNTAIISNQNTAYNKKMGKLVQKGNTVIMNNLKDVSVYNATGETVKDFRINKLDSKTLINLRNSGLFIIKSHDVNNIESVNRIIAK